jgi:hypothetical protein
MPAFLQAILTFLQALLTLLSAIFGGTWPTF